MNIYINKRMSLVTLPKLKNSYTDPWFIGFVSASKSRIKEARKNKDIKEDIIKIT